MEDRAHAPIERLSKRQLEVLELLAKGLTNEELAGVLGISPTTARTHVTAILTRLEAGNRTEAAALFRDWSAGPAHITGLLRRPALVVLPLVALDADPRSRSLACAIGHDLSNMFARWCWFPVITPVETVRERHADLDPAALGRHLGAAFVVEGNLRRSSPASWRLSVRIDSAASGHCLWTERYEFPADELFSVQDAVCEAVVATTYPMLVAYTQAGLRRHPHPHELQAWELAHEGMRLCALREAAANHRAQSLFHLAIEREPDLLLAHYGLGVASFDHLLNQWSDASAMRRQLLDSAERCALLAPHGAEGHYLLGRHYQSSGAPELATRSLESAVRHNPSFAPAHALMAQTLYLSGRYDDALARMRHAAQLGPGRYSAVLATVHFSRGDYEEALSAIEEVLVSSPHYSFARAVAAASAFLVGDLARAGEHAARLRDLGFSTNDFMSMFGARIEPVERIVAVLEQIAACSLPPPRG
ncbi:MAG: hypothetical protein JNL82_34900 [Myxococcales bacterium]|nr:hypothetical protein [Myxococcales bacterium]